MMMKFHKLTALTALIIFSTLNTHAAVTGWTNWRGPHQAGRSDATDLPKAIRPADALWTHDIAGRGHAVIADGRVFAWGYRGKGADLQEVLLCLNEADGKTIWEHGYNDYLSDTVYSRYTVGAPTIDPATGWIYLMTTNGGVKCFNADGKIQWEYSLMERFGRLTFPNGRTGAAVIDGDLVIVRGVTSYWGKQGPARDRFYAFKKKTGAPVWASTPGVAPKDSSFSTPVLANVGARRVFYAGTGDGNVVCVDVRTGQPLWRFQLSHGGVNSSVVVQDNILVAIHGKENIDSSGEGRMVGIKLPTKLPAPGEPQLILKDKDLKIADGKAWELWRLQHAMFTSSPTLANGRVYQVSKTGVLVCVDVKTGKELFAKKINNDQIHSSPLYADGHLYIGFPNGKFMVIKPGDDDAEIVSEAQLEGGILGSPVAWNGKIYLHTKTKLYCFGKANGQKPKATLPAAPIQIAVGKAVALQIIPGDVLLKPGQTIKLTVNTLDANGNVVERGVSAEFAKYIPPTAKVKTSMNAGVSNNAITADSNNVASAGAWMATAGGLKGILRGRILPKIPYTQDFESFKLTVDHKTDGVKFAYPPLAWTGARLKWEVREMDGGKVFAKTLDRVLFQRAITIFGDPNSSNYTIEADVMTDGSRRVKGNIGVMNQRYFITLVGNQQILEVSSNHERVKESVPFRWSPKKWYRLKSRVDIAADGSGIIRAKAWPKGEPEPKAWTLEVKHKNAHKKGAPGIIGFSPQSLFRVYMDNISIKNN
jgi:outer membrane protein assembly factor BamB